MVAAARAADVIAFQPRLATFEVFPGSASDRAHLISASTPEDAVTRFLEGWHPAVEQAQDVELTVVDQTTGAETRFVVDLE